MVAMPHMVKKIIKMEKRERGQKERERERKKESFYQD